MSLCSLRGAAAGSFYRGAGPLAATGPSAGTLALTPPWWSLPLGQAGRPRHGRLSNSWRGGLPSAGWVPPPCRPAVLAWSVLRRESRQFSEPDNYRLQLLWQEEGAF